jgi:hypothetical protein
MSNSTLHRPAVHSSWWYVAAGAVLAAAVLIVLITAIQQHTTSGYPGVPAVVHPHYRPVTQACFAGRAGGNAIDLARPPCAASR